MTNPISEPVGELAVIGMACRFPSAPDIDSFWRLLKSGQEGIRRFTEKELEAVPRDFRDLPNYVAAAGALSDTDLFDASLFGLTPREAQIMDPQQRLFLECGWQALEDAGYHRPQVDTNVGIFAGASSTAYRDYLLADRALVEAMGQMQVTIGNEKDHLAPRLSYLLDLKGPSVPVQTACSTSLVAVHLACQSLLQFESDIALAGGASVPTPTLGGYLYQEGGILSADGHCRTFDATAGGTVPSGGVGLVVLKRLAEALRDGDHIHAVIRGTAINNDGAAKVGYTAPSVEGQRRVIEEAQSIADVEPGEISYIEAHGTATALGDPIEIEALNQAFNAVGQNLPAATCPVGSVKSNIGHADAAAGIAGLIKTILCLKHRTLVPSLHYENPNPAIDFAGGPFFVNTETTAWEAEPRIAGVSSFGIGGTNAHVILAEAPVPEPPKDSGRPWQPVVLSAASEASIDRLRRALKERLESEEGQEMLLADVAFSLANGRRDLPWRWTLTCSRRDELCAALTNDHPPSIHLEAEASPSLVFVFPGQGTKYLHLGLDLYRQEPVFRRAVDTCCDLLDPHLGDLEPTSNFKTVLLDPDERPRLEEADLWQPAMFTVEYALALLWMSWGLQPAAMIGHSLGEIVAATVAGVLRLKDALALVAARGRGVRGLAAGAMLALPMDETSAREWARGSVALAAVNDAGLAVLSGPLADIDDLAERLAEHEPVRLASDRAFHSPMVEPLMDELRRLTAGFECGTPQIPFISNLSGTWWSREDSAAPDYWARHLRHTVRFKDGLDTLATEPGRLLLEVGPGDVLTRLARRQGAGRYRAVASLPDDESTSDRQLMNTLGNLWRSGFAIDWPALYAGERRRRVPLPHYPFDRQSYWCAEGDAPRRDGMETVDSSLALRQPPEKWLYQGLWQQLPAQPPRPLAEGLEHSGPWLIFCTAEGLGAGLARRLTSLGQEVLRVTIGDQLAAPQDDHLVLRPDEADDYSTLFEELRQRQTTPRQILHTWGLEHPRDENDILTRGFDSLIRIAQQMARDAQTTPSRLTVLTSRLYDVLGGEECTPLAALCLGAVRVIPKEISQLSCQHLDLEPAEVDAADDLFLDRLLADILQPHAPESRAWRRGRCWHNVCEPLPAPPPAPPWQSGETWLLVNGLQEIGLELAHHLVKDVGARVAFLDRSFFPTPDEWQTWLADDSFDPRISAHIRRLAPLGDSVRVLTAHPENAERLCHAASEAEAALGPVRGLIYLVREDATGLIQTKAPEEPSSTLAGWLREARAVSELVWSGALEGLRNTILLSSNPTESAGLGQVEQAAGYAFFDLLAEDLNRRSENLDHRAVAISWGTRGWQEETADDQPLSFIEQQLVEKRQLFGTTAEECFSTVERVLATGLAHVTVSTRDYAALLAQQSLFTSEYFQHQMGQAKAEGGSGSHHARPDLSTAYEPPSNEIERLLALEWCSFFGLEDIGIHDSFFELGGHSLLAVQVINKVNEMFATNLSLQSFFDTPSIAALAATLAASAPPDEDEAEALAALLEEIEGLSEDEVSQALKA